MTIVTPRPEDVFTPRKADVNPLTYVERAPLESALKRALRRSQHIVIYGESGTGKSWLYKRVLSTIEAGLIVANLSNAARLGSIAGELENVVARATGTRLTGYTQGNKASGGIGVAKGEIDRRSTYSVGQKEPFESALEMARKQTGSGTPAVIVLDNLEAIFGSEDLMSELANIVLLLDDERYAQYEVKLLIVGVPREVRSYFLKTPHRSSVANRLYEMPEVSRLSDQEARSLVYQGFQEHLKYAFDFGVFETLLSHAPWVSDHVPQRLQEYCLEVALLAEENGRIVTRDLLGQANCRWLGAGLSSTYEVVVGAMNKRETRVGRRNQTIFCLGLFTDLDFGVADVEKRVRKEFPQSTRDRTLNISAMLSSLESLGLVRRTPAGDRYMFLDPRFRMCIRAMLHKEDETVRRLDPISL